MERTGARAIAISASGRFVALRVPGGVDVVDVLGTAARRTFRLGDAGDFAIAGRTLCVVDDGVLRADALEGSEHSGHCAIAGHELAAFRGRAADAVIVRGEAGCELVAVTSTPHVIHTTPARWLPLHGRSVVTSRAHQVSMAGVVFPFDAEPTIVAPLFGGRVLACVIDATIVVVRPSGAIVHRVALPPHRAIAIAGERGLAVVASEADELVAIDLRLARTIGVATPPHRVDQLAIDDDGATLVLAETTRIPTVSIARRQDIFRPVVTVEVVDAVTGTTPHVDAPAVDAVETAPSAALPVVIPDLVPHGFGARAVNRVFADTAVIGSPFAHPGDHLAALLDLVAARAAAAIAIGWHTGRISADADGEHPFQREVLALAGLPAGTAADHVAMLADRVARRSEAIASDVNASVRAGMQLPFVELARELELSEVATQVIAVVAAPCVLGEIARLYRLLANDPSRPPCDAALVELLVADDDSRARERVAAELAATAPLVRRRIVRADPRSGLAVDDIVIDRLRGRLPLQRLSAATTVRRADRTLDALAADREALRDLVLAAAEPAPADAPLRLVVRGRRGAGRHTAIAALAARIDRPIACIDVGELDVDVLLLRDELVRALAAGCIPVVSGFERTDGDRDASQGLRRVLDLHPGPIVLRTSLEATIPLSPGYHAVTLPSLDERARAAFAATELGSLGVDPDRLVTRFRIGPGTIVRVAGETRRRLARAAGGDPDRVADEVASQHVAARMGTIAQRVTRLASWDQIALPDEMIDSLRELIGRARHSRTVYEDWGYDERIATARGLTALFYGPPGTGKTLVAGLVAAELGLPLYRVDLAKVMSKWVGETEKNLGEVFDAAEDGRAMLLFDEADSLFAKRTEVRSSNDRYANLEVNYLLQRLDAFDGVAILTTNLEGSIDPAFKRRMSMRLAFPFPDEDTRARLWAAHVTPRIPTAGTLDLTALAHRFPLSGGYIRNSAVRAAFLAAQEGLPLSQEHLERAVLLEYRELGKLAQDGRME